MINKGTPDGMAEIVITVFFLFFSYMVWTHELPKANRECTPTTEQSQEKSE